MDNNKRRKEMIKELKRLREQNEKLIELINILLRHHS